MTFDPNTFMNQVVDGPLETEFTLIPPGEYQATIDDFESDAFEQVQFEYKRGPRAGQPGTMTKFNVPFVIQDDAVKQELGREKVVVTKQLILDLDDNGTISHGKNKNIELGRIRDAVNQNTTDNWNPAHLRGAGPVIVKVTHIEFERRDGSKGKRAEIERVVRAA